MNWGELQDAADKGPWFTAKFDGGEASCCGEEIMAGETIRADGSGTYEHRECDDTPKPTVDRHDRFTGTSLDQMGY